MKYRDKQNLKFIKKKISEEFLPTPDALNKENISRLLYAETEYKPAEASKPKYISVKRIISIAACVVIVLSAISLKDLFTPVIAPKNMDYSSKNTSYNEYSEIKKQIEEIQKKNNPEIWLDKAEEYLVGEGVIDDGTDLGTGSFQSFNGEFAEDTVYETDGDHYGETYTQVEGVNEADIIQNDGKYIYATYDSARSFSILKADGNAVTPVSTTELSKGYIRDMYLYKDKLIINCAYPNTAPTAYDFWYVDVTGKTGTLIYDVSDKSAPQLLTNLTQDGDYISSRIIDNQLYIITNKNVNDKPKETEDYVPSVAYNDKSVFIPAGDICCIENPDTASYVVVSSYNLDNGKAFTDTKAVLGAGTNIYCSQDNLYVASESYNYFSGETFIETYETRIMKFTLNEGNIEFVTDTKVKGYTNNQYSFDEKEGYLRVATTYTDNNGNAANALFVLDENLKKVGSVTGFAKNEFIEAVKFIGDMAYVITFEQTDPLFVIDLSDPTKPEIKGEVEITGFSTMLHPVDENTLLGIGYASSSLPDGGWVDGIKLALFDISDPEKPAVLDSEVIKDCFSEAQYNPKAFMVNNDTGYYALPFDNSLYGKDGAITFEVNDNQIEITNEYTFENNDPYCNPYTALRCTYIDEYFYLIGTDWVEDFAIQAFEYSE